jgi:hypothetical protein
MMKQKRHFNRIMLLFLTLISIPVLALLLSCGPSPQKAATRNLLDGNFDATLQSIDKWKQKDTANPIPRFVSSICAYFLMNGDEASAEIRAIMSSPNDVATINTWLQETISEDPMKPMSFFLKAVNAQILKKHDEAVRLYKEAEKADPNNKLFRYSRIAAEESSAWAAEIPETDPLSYKGEMKLVGNVWIPVEEKFQVTGGKLRTKLGDMECIAEFGDWKPLISINEKNEIAWAAILTRGEIIVKSEQASSPKSPNSMSLGVECNIKADVFDYFGKYYIVVLNEENKTTYPIIPVPFFMTEDGTWDGRIILGNEIDVDPENFQRIRSWEKNINAVIMNEEATIYQGEGASNSFGGMFFMEETRRQTLFGNLRINVSKGQLYGPVMRAGSL